MTLRQAQGRLSAGQPVQHEKAKNCDRWRVTSTVPPCNADPALRGRRYAQDRPRIRQIGPALSADDQGRPRPFG